MKLVIEIDKKAFDYIMACSFVEDESVMLNQSLEDRIKTLMLFDVLNAIKSSTPLPKGHGRLIDADKIQFENAEFDTYGDYSRAFDAIDQAETIVEADGGGEDEEA